MSGWAEGAGVADEGERRRGAIVAELLGSTEALATLSESPAGALAELFEALSELDDALRNLGRSPSSLLFEELLDELAVLSSELDVALRNFGRSGSLLLDALLDAPLEELFEELLAGLLDEVLVSSPELESARRNWGRSPEPDELLAELVDEGLVIGRVGSSVACDAAACSSSVPSFTIAMVWAL